MNRNRLLILVLIAASAILTVAAAPSLFAYRDQDFAVVYRGLVAKAVSPDGRTLVIVVDVGADDRADRVFLLGVPSSAPTFAGAGVMFEPMPQEAVVTYAATRLLVVAERDAYSFELRDRDVLPTPQGATRVVIDALARYSGRGLSIPDATQAYLDPVYRPLVQKGGDIVGSSVGAACGPQRLVDVRLASSVEEFFAVAQDDPCQAGGPGSHSCGISGCEDDTGDSQDCHVECGGGGGGEPPKYACCYCNDGSSAAAVCRCLDEPWQIASGQ